MTNGDEGNAYGNVDPWKWAGIRELKKSEIYAHVITCDDCAHCVDLHYPNSHDAKDLTNTRAYEMTSIKKWISDHWKAQI